MQYSPHQLAYFAQKLTLRGPTDSMDRMAGALLDAQVDLNPHQIDAALFATSNPLSKGVILADEVGLGKTIEAGLLLAQRWAERKRRLLIITPANLRKQWHQELADKFGLSAVILEAKSFRQSIKDGLVNPFDLVASSGKTQIVICSYQFAAGKAAEVRGVSWDLVVVDEAHRLRNVYKPDNKIARILRDALAHARKVFLTATPLQNSLLELYGLVSFIDEQVFGDLDSFKQQFGSLREAGSFDGLKQRISPICKRTLRRQVGAYVKYTKRIPLLREFSPGAEEARLYDLVTEYLQRDSLYALPNSHLPQRGFRASEHLLRKAFEWFDRRVAELLKASKGSEDSEGMRLARLVEDMSDRLFFTVITVTDELNAYKVFETLNERGVRLSATDLLKNYLFSVLDRGNQNEHELRSLEERWEAMVGRLQSENFPDFLRVHWNSRRAFARQSELFKTIRGQVSTREAVFQLLRDMEQDLDTYLALSSPEASDWPQETKLLAGTLRTFNVRQPYPLLLAAKRVFDPPDFAGLMRACVVISMRFNVICGYSTAEQERTYNAVSERVAKEEIKNLGAALAAMPSIYPNDTAFRAAFAEKTIRTTQSRNNRVVRYILCALEKHLSGQDYSFTSDNFNIEHVLPQSPKAGWEAFSNDEADALTYRLGNMTLMQAGANKDLGNTAYALKRAVFAQSGFGITAKLAADHAEWTPERLAAHQNWMATQATAIWRIAQMG